ncbi:MAG: DUF2812 domain-containing protein [Lachnospiraceae bacterium]|nr:DUF2812 domain-containing protein [Lachnospiraceae bacterium]
MRDKKRVFRGYSYTQCDEFADYLTEMARKGWKFASFGLGLCFERTEPSEEVYDVQVFLKNSEMDTAPEPDTEEFAEYCAAAGWEMVDSSRRFVVFRRIKEDSVPIVTQEEKLANVFQAERKKQLSDLGTNLIVTANLFFQAYMNPRIWLFQRYLPWLLVVAAVTFLIDAIRLLTLFGWHVDKKKELAVFGEVSCRGSFWQKVYPKVRYLEAAFCLFALIVSFWNQPVVWVSIVLIAVFILAIGEGRPSRSENWAIQIGGSLAFVFVIFIVALAVVMSGPSKRVVKEESEMPLTIAEFPGTTDEIKVNDIYHSKSLLGEMWAYDVESSGKTFLDYELYRSKYPWVIHMVWRSNTRYVKENAIEDNAQWNVPTVSYVADRESYQYVLGYDFVLRLHTSKEPTAEEVLLIKRELGLAESSDR